MTKESIKKYRLSEKGKAAHNRGNKKYSQTEKGKEARRRSNLQPVNIARRQAWFKSEKGKEKKKLINYRYYLKKKIQKVKSKLSFEKLYFLDIFILLLMIR